MSSSIGLEARNRQGGTRHEHNTYYSSSIIHPVNQTLQGEKSFGSYHYLHGGDSSATCSNCTLGTLGGHNRPHQQLIQLQEDTIGRQNQNRISFREILGIGRNLGIKHNCTKRTIDGYGLKQKLSPNKSMVLDVRRSDGVEHSKI